MTERVERPALRGTFLGGLLRLWNPAMKWLLRSPLHWPWSRWFLIIEWTGRKTQRRYRTPVSYVRQGDEILITTGDRWWRQVVGGAPVRVWISGRARGATADVVLDEAESADLHQRMFELKPAFAVLAGIPGRDREAQIRRSIAAGRRLVRLRLKGA